MKNPVLKYQCLGSWVIHFSFILCLMMIVILPNSVFGKMNKDFTFSLEELKAMPKWCQIRMLVQNRVVGVSRGKAFGENVPDSTMNEYYKWAKVIGEDIFRYTHHYCAGLNWINRYKLSFVSQYKGVERDRDFALKSALNEFRFMRGRLRPKHKLYYAMLMKEAYIYGEKKNFKKAIKNYSEIIKLKPRYVSAYVEYAQLLNSIGNSENAIKVLQFGLKKNKGSKIIEQLIVTWGGGKQ